MTINLINEKMLGHWDVSPTLSQCEFQFGHRLIYVQHPKGVSPQKYITKAQQSIVDVWNDIMNAISFAEEISRTQIPDFWKVHDAINKLGKLLDVYSIHFNLDESSAIYAIGKNHEFDFEYITYAEDDFFMEKPLKNILPEFPDNMMLSIRRLGNCNFTFDC
jgi:hypothetical protein